MIRQGLMLPSAACRLGAPMSFVQECMNAWEVLTSKRNEGIHQQLLIGIEGMWGLLAHGGPHAPESPWESDLGDKFDAALADMTAPADGGDDAATQMVTDAVQDFDALRRQVATNIMGIAQGSAQADALWRIVANRDQRTTAGRRLLGARDHI